MKKDIFFVCYGGGHINIIEPIVDSFLEDENYAVTLLALTSAYEKVKNKYDNKVLKRISDYLFLFDDHIEDILRNALLIFDENYNPDVNISKLEILSYLGICYTEEIRKYGAIAAYDNYKNNGRQSFLPEEAMTVILSQVKPNFVITTTSPRFEKASIMAANHLGIKSIKILDLYDDSVKSSDEKASFTIVMNDCVKSNLVDKGFGKDEVLVLGQPAIEKSINSILQLDRRRLLHRFSKNSELENLVYFSQPPLDYISDNEYLNNVSYDQLNPFIFDILNSVSSSFNVFFRIHPNENIEDYSQYFLKYSNIQFINNDLDLSESIALCDLAITPYSTVALEAACTGKRVYTYKPNFSSKYPIKFLKNYPFIYSDSFQELKLNLNEKSLEKTVTENMLKLEFENNLKLFIENEK